MDAWNMKSWPANTTPQKLKGCFNSAIPSFNDRISPVTPKPQRNVHTIEVNFDIFGMIGF